MKAKDYNRSILDMEHEIRWLKAQQLFFAYNKWCAENEIRPESTRSKGRIIRRRDSPWLKSFM